MSPRIIARRLADLPALAECLENGDDGTCRQIFTSVAVTADIDYVYLLDAGGNVLAANESDTGIDLTGNNYSFRPYFIKAMTGEPQIYTALGVTTHIGGCYYSVPVYDSRYETPAGVLVMAVKEYNVRFSIPQPAAQSAYLLVSPEGVVIYGSTDKWNYTVVNEYRTESIDPQQYGSGNLIINGEDFSEGFHVVDGAFAFVSSRKLPGLPFKLIVISPFALLGGLRAASVLQLVFIAFAFFTFTVLIMELIKRFNVNKDQQQRLEIRLSWEQGIAEASRMLIASNTVEEDIQSSLGVLLESWDLDMITFIQEGLPEDTFCYNCSVGEISESKIHSLIHIPIAVRNADELFGHLIFYCDDKSRIPKESGAMELLETYARVLGTVIGRQIDFKNLIKLERELQMSHKMEAIGTLAGGIAHDFNNVLAAIRGSVDLSFLSLENTDVIQENLTIIREASERAAEFVKQILTFSRQQTGEKKLLGIDGVVKEFLPLIRGGIHPNIEIIADTDCGDQSIMGDKPQLGQLVLNLCTNAAHAIGANSGILTISTFPEYVIRKKDALGGDIPSGKYSVLLIKDTGEGMPKEVLKRVFEPFFTTKENSGTGLGLAVVHGVVKNHGGYIAIDSAVGSGTAVAVYFPEYGKRVDVQVRSGHRRIMERKKGKVVLVEDESQLADLGFRILEKLGYEPVVYTDPLEALEEFPHLYQYCIAVIVDYYMPGMNGLDLARELKVIDPDVPVFLTSGYVNDDLYEVPWINSVLFKPYNTDELDEIIRSKGRTIAAARVSEE